MIKVIYSPLFGTSVEDGRAQSMVGEWVYHGQVDIIVSSLLLIVYALIAVKEEKISLENFELYYQPNGNLDSRRRIELTKENLDDQIDNFMESDAAVSCYKTAFERLYDLVV